MNDSSRGADQIIEEVLARRPLAILPAGFVDQVMAEVQNTQVPLQREEVHFRLELFDIVVPILVAFLLVLALALTGQLPFLEIVLPIQWPAILPTTNLSPPLEWAASNWMVLITLFVIAEIGLGVLFCTWLWPDSPLSQVEVEGA